MLRTAAARCVRAVSVRPYAVTTTAAASSCRLVTPSTVATATVTPARCLSQTVTTEAASGASAIAVVDESSLPIWRRAMPEQQFTLMRNILAAPSPVGLEASMTRGVIEPYFKEWMPSSWKVHTFKGNAGIVVDTHPHKHRASTPTSAASASSDMFTVMIVGHADKIRMQVRHIGSDGKIWIDSDSFLPLTLLGNEVTIFSEDPKNPASYRSIQGGTVEALGAIHFASQAHRSGDKGVKKDQLYIELGVHGSKRGDQIKKLGIRPGDSVILNRPIKRGFSQDSFFGAYLDNGLGCFVTAEVARLVAQRQQAIDKVRCLFTFAAYEEIGRFGSRVLAQHFKPDAIIATDVNHDYVAAPGIGDRRMPPLSMGEGFTLSVGSIASEALNTMIESVAVKHNIPYQRDVCGTDTGTDAMSGVLGGIDAAATSIGFPIRNMHTVSELGHTGDVLSAIHAIYHTIDHMNTTSITPATLSNSHPRLDTAVTLPSPSLPRTAKKEDKKEKDEE